MMISNLLEHKLLIHVPAAIGHFFIADDATVRPLADPFY